MAIKIEIVQELRGIYNSLCGYRVRDESGNTLDITDIALKRALANKEVILNDNYKPKKSKKLDSMMRLIDKAITIGSYEALGTECNAKCILIHKSDEDHILYIPKEVTLITSFGTWDWRNKLDVSLALSELSGRLTVVGGWGLTNARLLFGGCTKLNHLDLSMFDTHNVTDMKGMFKRLNLQTLDLSGLDTSNVVNMMQMFDRCTVPALDLSSFNTHNVETMEQMFNECDTRQINLSSFNVENVTNMREMFMKCKAECLDLSSFDVERRYKLIPKGCTVNNMFYCYKGKLIADDRKIRQEYYRYRRLY